MPHPRASGDATSVTVTITAGTTSAAFGIPGAIAFALIGTTGTTGRTLTLQRLGVDGETWVDTALTATTSDIAEQVWTSEDLAPYAALFGRSGNLRLLLSATDSITVVIDCRNG